MTALGSACLIQALSDYPQVLAEHCQVDYPEVADGEHVEAGADRLVLLQPPDAPLDHRSVQRLVETCTPSVTLPCRSPS